MQFNPISPNIGSQGQQVLPGQKDNLINYLLPIEIIYKILRQPFLSDIEQAKAREVCRLWRDCGKKITDPNVIVFGVKAWEKYFGCKIEGEVPRPPARIVETVKSLRDRLKGKNEAPLCTAILMPKGLTLNKLKGLMENPQKGYSTKIVYIWDIIVVEHGDKAIEKSYWFVMTNDVIEGSRNKSYADQKDLVKRKIGSEYELPTFLEVFACCVMHHVSSGKYLFVQNPCTYTRCQDQIDGRLLAVGGFASGGLCVDDDLVFDRIGVAARLKFC